MQMAGVLAHFRPPSKVSAHKVSQTILQSKVNTSGPESNELSQRLCVLDNIPLDAFGIFVSELRPFQHPGYLSLASQARPAFAPRVGYLRHSASPGTPVLHQVLCP